MLPIFLMPPLWHLAQVPIPALSGLSASQVEELIGIPVMLYLVRVILRLDKTVGSVITQLYGGPKGDGGISAALERLESGYQRLNDAVTKQGLQLDIYAEDTKAAIRKTEECPYHGQDRRVGGTEEQ